MNHIREHIYLAALLHDIGKFYQRADTGSVATSKYLKQYNKDESSFCPLYNGGYTHKHVLWTAQFIDDYNAVFAKLVQHSALDLTDDNNLLKLAAGHHLGYNQLTDLGRIIKEADCLSSGMDRDSEIALQDDIDELGNWDDFKRKRLVPITDTICRNDKQLENLGRWRQNLCPLSLTQDYFPQKANTNRVNEQDYRRLWEEFTEEFKFIQADSYKAFSETLLSVLYKYTTCIPSSTINFPDVSLYDHLKTTAALAVCLYDVYESEEAPSNSFLLIGGDLSGIQPYIYQIVSKYASKNLKGRSFYLRLLCDAIVHYLLDQLDLYQSNVIYNSGGGFYIVAPNTNKTKKKLSNAVTNIEEQMFAAHGVDLFLAVDSIEMSKETLKHKSEENLGTVWHKLFEKKELKKNARCKQIVTNNYQKFFMPSMPGCNGDIDVVTGEYFDINEQSCKESDLAPLRHSTKEQIKLGRVLKDFDCIVISDGEIGYWPGIMHIEPLHLGVFYYFIRHEDLKLMREKLCASADNVTVATYNGCDFLGFGMVEGINNAYRLEFYGGNGVKSGFNTTFEQMCDNLTNEANAFERLGVLRMDVDNLGYIFQQGISPERYTLSRMSALSRSFDYFFSGYLNTIWSEEDAKRSFIIYSGGDDLFIIGSWNVTIRLAERIHNDFKLFTCQNPAFSISGGIAVTEPKFPIVKGAQMSADEENKAKNHKCDGKEKNAISFFGMPLNFDEEYPQVKQLKERIVELCNENEKPLPRSFISKVRQHLANAKIDKHQISNMKIYWMLTYDLSRMEDRQCGNDVKTVINNCKAEVCGNKQQLNGIPINSNYHPLELWALACRWAELELRSQK